MLLGASPGGTMANVLTHLARGDTALSVTITAISSLAAAITVPLYLELASRHFDAQALVGDVAMALDRRARVPRHGRPGERGDVAPAPLARRASSTARPHVARLAAAVFVLVVAGAVASEHDTVLDNLGAVLGAVIALNVDSARDQLHRSPSSPASATGRRPRSRWSWGSTTRRSPIAVGSALATELTVPAAVYGSVMFVSGGLFARVMYRRNAAATYA